MFTGVGAICLSSDKWNVGGSDIYYLGLALKNSSFHVSSISFVFYLLEISTCSCVRDDSLILYILE